MAETADEFLSNGDDVIMGLGGLSEDAPPVRNRPEGVGG